MTLRYHDQEIFDHNLNVSAFWIDGEIIAEHASFSVSIPVCDGDLEDVKVHVWPNSYEGCLSGPATEAQYELSKLIGASLALDEWYEFSDDLKKEFYE